MHKRVVNQILGSVLVCSALSGVGLSARAQSQPAPSGTPGQSTQSRPGQASAAGRPAITGIAFMRMYAADPQQSDAFYRMLGLQPEPVGKSGPGLANPAVRRYDVNRAQWLETEPLPQPAPASRQAMVGFTTTDAARLEHSLRAAGVTEVQPLAAGMFVVLDPEGNRVAFVQAGSHHRMPQPVGGSQGAPVPSSTRVLHVGYMVHSRAAEDTFYRDLLGFRPYWHGGMTDDRTDFVSLQVPDGTDWLEYMLDDRLPTDDAGKLRQLGVLDHVSLGVEKMDVAEKALAANGCAATRSAHNCATSQMGRDGKVQLNVFDPDQTRIEYMEYLPTGKTCCSAFTGTQPSASDPEAMLEKR